jgi:PPM family protein phosphatase
LIITFSKTDVGKKRKTNQDFVYTHEQPIGNLPNLFAVADGMGGHRAGDYASRHTVETVEKIVSEDAETDPLKILEHAVKGANRSLLTSAKEHKELAGMGTTLVLCTIKGDYLYAANIGDSRLYLINRKIQQISRDHSLVAEMVRVGEIRPDEAKRHPDRNVITRAIGITEEVEPDFFDMRLLEDDILLLCSDGLTNMVEDDAIFEVVQSSRDIVEMVESLVRLANQNGGKDNIGVVMIQNKSDEEKSTC